MIEAVKIALKSLDEIKNECVIINNVKIKNDFDTIEGSNKKCILFKISKWRGLKWIILKFVKKLWI